MAKGYIDSIRKYKNKKAKIGGLVTYAGHPYRIASADHGGSLILRAELRVHPNDSQLHYESKGEILLAKALLDRIVELEHENQRLEDAIKEDR